MRLSIRSKVLATYGVLAVLLLVVLFSSLTRINRIGTRLNVIRDAYLPIAKTINASLNFYHLDEGFDVARIIANRQNRLFMDSITLTNPRLLEGGLKKGLLDARAILAQHPSPAEERRMGRIAALIDDLVNHHRKYTTLISQVNHLLQKGKISKAQAKNPSILQAKRTVRNKIEFLNRRLDEQIQEGIHSTLAEEKSAIFWTLSLSVGTLILALFIGLVALFMLRPLAKLKRAAQEIAAGDLKQRVSIKTRDEIGELGQEFNRMADSIQERDRVLHTQQERLVQTEKMAVVGRMASKISHEIRNPLNALGLNIEMLEDEVASEEGRKILQSTLAAIDRLNHVAESYLSMARAPKQDAQELNLLPLLSRLEKLIEAECKEKDLSFRLEIPESLPRIKADATRIEQSMLNLVRNAMEASSKGNSFGIKVNAQDQHVHIHVWDQGSGISEEQKNRIFDPFFTTKDKGTGLGLSITNEIIREEGGEIICNSQPNEGTCFEIKLPTSTSNV